MNRLQEQELVQAMTEVQRLRAALEAAERERDEWKREAELSKWPKEAAKEYFGLRAERDALRERAEAAEKNAENAVKIGVAEGRRSNALRERAEAAEARLNEELAWDFGGSGARQLDALREQVEAARRALQAIEQYVGDGRDWLAGDPVLATATEGLAALARLGVDDTSSTTGFGLKPDADQRETENRDSRRGHVPGSSLVKVQVEADALREQVEAWKRAGEWMADCRDVDGLEDQFDEALNQLAALARLDQRETGE